MSNFSPSVLRWHIVHEKCRSHITCSKSDPRASKVNNSSFPASGVWLLTKIPRLPVSHRKLFATLFSLGRFAARPMCVEHWSGRQGQAPLRRVAAKAGLPECRRAPGGVTAAHVLGFDDEDAAIRHQSGAQACAGYSPADDDDVIRVHAAGGYGFESRGV